MRFTTVNDWLSWQQTLNTSEIDLGLDRVHKVLNRMGHPSTFSGPGFSCPLITVAGTNGKGSVVAMLETMAMAMGLRVASYTSPHLVTYNERIRLNTKPIDDAALCHVFQHVDDIREDVALTYFEFGTLAAIDYFFQQKPDLVILEVGLGGRLDAVNVMDADVAVITTVDIDHVDWLGDDRERIGYEKAGILRKGQYVVYGDQQPVSSVIEQAKALECQLQLVDTDFKIVVNDDNWTYTGKLGRYETLPMPGLRGEFQLVNAAVSITALLGLISKGQLYVDGVVLESEDMFKGVMALPTVQVKGRFQKLASRPDVYVDVAHNPQAARSLASMITGLRDDQAGRQQVWVIIAMLADKDVESVLQALAPVVDRWCFCPLSDTDRGLSADGLITRAVDAGIIPVGIVQADAIQADDLQGEPDPDDMNSTAVACESRQNQCTMLDETLAVAESVTSGCRYVLASAKPEDIIIIAGSFYTVSEAMNLFPGATDNPDEDNNG